jgi:F1F0 ATPase subunit 2
MIDWLYVILIAIFGNLFYFAGLYITVKKLSHEKKSWGLIIGSFFTRISIVAGLLYLTAKLKNWQGLALYAVIFLIMRFIATKKINLFKTKN